jgi:hypothetical protein
MPLSRFSLASIPAQAATLIPGVTASSTTFVNIGFDINNTVNGSGLPGNVPALTGVHSIIDDFNFWTGNGETGNIDFALNGIYELDGFSFWNPNVAVTSSLNWRLN